MTVVLTTCCAPAETGQLSGLVTALQVTEVYQERRLDAVFAMWDQNSDLRISFKELCEGLYRCALHRLQSA